MEAYLRGVRLLEGVAYLFILCLRCEPIRRITIRGAYPRGHLFEALRCSRFWCADNLETRLSYTACFDFGCILYFLPR